MSTSANTPRVRRLALSLGVAALAIAVIAPVAGAANAKTKRVSIRSGGGQANGPSFDASTSADGRYVAFRSSATNLVGNDTNDSEDVFIHDRVTKKTKRVSVRSNGAQANGPSGNPSVSATGRYVAFGSDASNLVGSDTPGSDDVFVRDRKTKTTRRVSVKKGGGQADDDSFAPSISANGRFVAFYSEATDLIGNDTNSAFDVFVYDRKAKKTRRVSVKTGGGQANGPSSIAAISANGRFVAFRSEATDLVNNDTNDKADIFVHDRKTGKTKRVSVRSNGAEGTGGGSFEPSISADGRFVAFRSSATNLVANDTNDSEDVFVHDRWTKKTKRVSVNTRGGQGENSSFEPSISANGRWVAFASDAANLVGSDSNDHTDVFVHDRKTKKTRRVSLKTGGHQAVGGSEGPSISADGRYVAFESEAKLIPKDTTADWDIYARGPVR